MTAYCEQANLNNIYGATAINRWADLDGDNDSATIEARVTWACDLATEYLNSRLINSYYAIPFDPVPTMIVNLAAMYAGILLHDGRLIHTSEEPRDQVSRQRKDFDRFLKQILRGQLKLLHPETGEMLPINTEYNSPFVVSDTESDELVDDDGTHIIFGD